jgi:XTP/dITP diphosphohydrolase
VPVELIPEAITSVRLTVDGDAETDFRSTVLEFMDTVRSAEKAVAAARRGQNIAEALDVAPLGVITEEEWRANWPQVTDQFRTAPEEPVTYDNPLNGEAHSDEALSSDEQIADSVQEDSMLSVQDGDTVSEATAE